MSLSHHCCNILDKYCYSWSWAKIITKFVLIVLRVHVNAEIIPVLLRCFRNSNMTVLRKSLYVWFSGSCNIKISTFTSRDHHYLTDIYLRIILVWIIYYTWYFVTWNKRFRLGSWFATSHHLLDRSGNVIIRIYIWNMCVDNINIG